MPEIDIVRLHHHLANRTVTIDVGLPAGDALGQPHPFAVNRVTGSSSAQVLELRRVEPLVADMPQSNRLGRDIDSLTHGPERGDAFPTLPVQVTNQLVMQHPFVSPRPAVAEGVGLARQPRRAASEHRPLRSTPLQIEVDAAAMLEEQLARRPPAQIVASRQQPVRVSYPNRRANRLKRLVFIRQRAIDANALTPHATAFGRDLVTDQVIRHATPIERRHLRPLRPPRLRHRPPTVERVLNPPVGRQPKVEPLVCRTVAVVILLAPLVHQLRPR